MWGARDICQLFQEFALFRESPGHSRRFDKYVQYTCKVANAAEKCFIAGVEVQDVLLLTLNSGDPQCERSGRGSVPLLSHITSRQQPPK